MINALRAVLRQRVAEADTRVQAARTRMDGPVRAVRADPADVEQARLLDEAARDLERARAFAEGAHWLADVLRAEVLGDTEPVPMEAPADGG